MVGEIEANVNGIAIPRAREGACRIGWDYERRQLQSTKTSGLE
jgi:hypothetical protein